MKAFDSSRLARDARAVSQEREQACDRLTFRCLARLHATRHIRATLNEPLFRVVLLQGIGLEIQNETAGFQNEMRFC
jgi:hypothetical protein